MFFLTFSHGLLNSKTSQLIQENNNHTFCQFRLPTSESGAPAVFPHRVSHTYTLHRAAFRCTRLTSVLSERPVTLPRWYFFPRHTTCEFFSRTWTGPKNLQLIRDTLLQFKRLLLVDSQLGLSKQQPQQDPEITIRQSRIDECFGFCSKIFLCH